MAKKKLQKTDGLGPLEIKKIRQAVRQVWHRSYARALVVKRCLLPNGFSKCEECGEVVAAVKVDHTDKVGDVDSGFIKRMFVSSKFLRGLCKKCHDKKTAQERKDDKKKLKTAELSADWI